MTEQHAKEYKALVKAGAYFSPAGSFVAGGALTSVFTGKSVNDIDLYFKDRPSFESAIREAYDNGFWCAEVTDRAVTFKDSDEIIQLMHFKWFQSAQDIFDCFDFTCCMAAFDNDGKDFIFDGRFLKHASQRHLEFHSGTHYPFASLIRVLKYQARGYTIGKGDLLQIALACHGTKLNSWEDLVSQIGGIYGEQVAIAAVGEFSIMAAIEALAGDPKITAKGGIDCPSSADELLAKIFGDYSPETLS